MKIEFSKLHGTGNDFVIISDWDKVIKTTLSESSIRSICSRHVGVGADGLILIQPSDQADIHMIYFNADGRPSSMCGNGGRCVAYWASQLKLAPAHGVLMAADGIHQYTCNDHTVELEMRPTIAATKYHEDYVIDTGSPHYVKFVEDFSESFVLEARSIRMSTDFIQKGVNVNFVKILEQGIEVRTFERGVEDETLSCGTGVTAAALVHCQRSGFTIKGVQVRTKGGELHVSYDDILDNAFNGVSLKGPVKHVFEGQLEL